MKEYIDISKINDWNELEIIGDDGEAYCVYDVSELPRANVIEKEKIDKAIEEIMKYARFHRDKTHNDTERGKYLAYEKCIEIIDKLIKEHKSEGE